MRIDADRQERRLVKIERRLLMRLLASEALQVKIEPGMPNPFTAPLYTNRAARRAQAAIAKRRKCDFRKRPAEWAYALAA